jgi:AraC family transcriptional regulator, transcriptional activator of pobA
MKIIVTGSLGNISKPLAKELIEKGHEVTVISSSLERKSEIESLGAHIHEKLIEKAKEKLSTTQLSVSEIAYELGFEHPQSFSKLFKSKTDLSPLGFRKAFN